MNTVNSVDGVPDTMEMLSYSNQSGRQSFEYEAVEETNLTLQSLYPKLIPDIFAAPLKRAYYALTTWVIGPQPPRVYTIQPAFRYLQIAPIQLLRRYSSQKTRVWLLLSIYIVWATIFLGTLGISVFGCQTADYRSPLRLSCNSRFW